MNVETLRQVPLFESLDTEAAHELCELLESLDCKAGSLLFRPRSETEASPLYNRGSQAARTIHGLPRYQATQTMELGVASRRSFAGERWNGDHNNRNAPPREATNHWQTTLLDHPKLTWSGSLLVLINAFAARS